MLRNHIQAAMAQVHYEIIDQAETPYYGEITGLRGVLTCGKTLEEYRANLEEALDAWLVLGLQMGCLIPEICA